MSRRPCQRSLLNLRATIVAALLGFGLGGLWATRAEAADTQNASQNTTLTNGLVGLWSFDGPDVSGTTAYDRSGNGNNGTLTNGPVRAIGKLGQGLSFDAANSQYVALPATASVKGLSAASVSAWVYFTAAGGRIYYESQVSDGATRFGMRQNSDGTAETTCRKDGDSSPNLVSAATYSLNAWHHVAAVCDTVSDNLILYVDGAQAAIDTAARDPFSSTNPANTIAIGAYTASTPSYFTGTIDDVRIYNRALSPQEVADLYNLGTATHNGSQNTALTTGLVGLWSFDGPDVSGTTAYDRSGQGNNGTLTGASGLPVPAAGKLGQGLKFDGVTPNYVAISGFLGSPANISLSAWVNLDPNETDNCEVISLGDNAAMRVESATGVVGFFYDGTTWRNTTWTATVSKATWHHLAYTHNDTADSQIVYFDGQPVANSSFTGSISYAYGSETHIGVHGANPSNIMCNGTIDDVRIYNRALSPQEVADLYNLGTATHNGSQNTALTTGLVGLWSFDGPDVSGTTAYDRSGQGHNGTLTNGPLLTVGKIGQGIELNGSNNYVDTVTAISNFISATDGSISVWVKPKATGAAGTAGQTYGCPGIAVEENGQGNVWISQCNVSGADRIWVGNWDGNADEIGIPYTVGEWVHVVWVHTGGTLYAYKNGTLVSSTASGNSGGGNGWLEFGPNYTQSSFFNGTLDDVRIYNRALSAQEVQDLYNLGR